MEVINKTSHHDEVGESSSSSSFPTPFPGASLMLAFRPLKKKILVLGTRRLAASRIINILEADAIPVLIGVDCVNDDDDDNNDILKEASEEVRWRIKQNQCLFVKAPKQDSKLNWSELIDELDGEQREIFGVCITDTLHAGDEEATVAGEENQTQVINKTNQRLSPLSRAKLIVDLCKSRRIPINVADHPDLCDFTFPASHRFSAEKLEKVSDNKSISSFSSSLQIAVTTNGRGCRLATRIRREIVANLPRNVGDAVERIGEMREMAKGRIEKRHHHSSTNGGGGRERSLRRKATGFDNPTGSATGVEDVEEEDLSFDTTPINSPVPQLGGGSGARDYLSSPTQSSISNAIDAPAAAAARLAEREAHLMAERKRRMRWVAQMSEYWPISYLGSLARTDMVKALDTYNGKNSLDDEKDQIQQLMKVKEEEVEEDENMKDEEVRGRNKNNSISTRRASSQHSLTIPQPPLNQSKEKGRIFLVGSGTGHPGLLTAMAYRLLTSPETDIILSDKLVPSSILNLIPKNKELHIARKFPGNAEGAQSELIALALEAAGKQGKSVVRLKQGDPFVYGRGGEEVLAFKKAGIQTTIIPGISSALAAPLLLGIPITQRGSADSMTLCTGVGRGGKSVKLPGYERSRSLVILMGVARLHDVIKTLCNGWKGIKEDDSTGTRIGLPFPPFTPIAIIERASSTDQRMVASTLDGIENALTRCGEQRPPGMMVVGWSVMSLDGGEEGNVDILDDEQKCGEDIAALEELDKSRIQRWLGSKGYLIREGLDQAYTRELKLSSSYNAGVQQQPGEGEQSTLEKVAIDFPLTSSRGPSGWAPPRYGIDGTPRGGWGNGEEKIQETV